MNKEAYHNEIMQLRADAVALNNRILDLRQKGLSDEIGVTLIHLTFASEYEFEMYRVWDALTCMLKQKSGYAMFSVQEVDAALIRSGVPLERLSELRYQIANDIDTELTSRFFDEVTGIQFKADEE